MCIRYGNSYVLFDICDYLFIFRYLRDKENIYCLKFCKI